MTVERVLRKKGKSLKDFNVAIEMGSTSSVKEGVKARLGLAFISRRAVEEELNRNLFTSITLEGLESISRQIYIVSQRGKTVSPAGMEFLRFLKRKRERTN
jgi:phosphonate transport system ATP-binding protein